MTKILILSANPQTRFLPNLNREITDLKDSLRNIIIQQEQTYEIDFDLAIESEKLQNRLSNFHPDIIHFCGHGAGKKGLVFLDQQGNEEIISTENFTKTLKIFRKRIKYVVLNACESDYQAKEVSQHIHFVIGINQSIFDRSAYKFSVGFYTGLANGEEIEIAYQMGCNAIKLDRTKSDSQRKAIFDGELKNQSSSPEDEKPQLYIRGDKYKVSEETFAPLSTELKQELEQEFKRKDNKDRNHYKDNAVKSYENFGRHSEQNQENPVKLEKEEKTQREIFVKKVKESWIDGFLEPDLNESVTNIDLEWESRPDALDESYQSLRDTQTYTEMGQGKTLLILGEPGAGKTIALLKLAKRLLERSKQDLTLPMPVVFNLSSWASYGDKNKLIFEWLIDELREKYQVPKSISEPWLKKQQLILLLDGLDEVKKEYRNDCVEAINQFIKYNFKTEVAVCSRVKDYEELTARLKISSAICLKPLTKEQTYEFLDKMGGNLNGLKNLLHGNDKLEELASNPLLVNIMSFAYQLKTVQDLTPRLLNITEQQQKENIFDDYIDYRLQQNTQIPTEYQGKVIHWLSWLASQMVREKQTIFLIENMQPTWLSNDGQKIRYRWGSILLASLLSFAVASLHLIIQKEDGWKYFLLTGIPSGIGVAVFYLIDGKYIKVTEELQANWQAIKNNFIKSLNLFPIAFVTGFISSFLERRGVVELYKKGLDKISRMDLKPWSLGLIYMFIIMIVVSIIYIIVADIPSIKLSKKLNEPNSGIWISRNNALTIGFIVFLLGSIIFWVMGLFIQGHDQLDATRYGVGYGLIIGLVFSIACNSGRACLKHLILRLILFKDNKITCHYANFLHFCTKQLLMRKIGGGYIFYHRMLLERFARISALL